jgi:nucleoid DNA-binding protein
MDVAKYIGLFLLKNNFVYIHGLGNLELRKRPASYDGEKLQGSSYEVVMTTMGSIDDNLANFIATNEQISISKASNSLREFSQQARADLQAGKPVVIPSIGSFVEERGKTTFITDPNFQYTPPAIGSMRVARRQEETVYAPTAEIPVVKPRYIDPDTETEATGISWVKIAAWGAILIAVCAAIYFGIRYMSSQKNTTEAPLIENPVDTPRAAAPVMPDSTAVADSTAAIASDNGLLSFDVILNTYTDLAKAQRRVDKLKSFGNTVELVTEEDSSTFYVILPVANVATADTARLMDSLKATFNPTYGVRILE